MRFSTFTSHCRDGVCAAFKERGDNKGGLSPWSFFCKFSQWVRVENTDLGQEVSPCQDIGSSD